MPPVSHWQARTIARFLEASRQLFDMPARRRYASQPVKHCRRSIVRSLLVAGSIGTLVGNAAVAAPAAAPSRHPPSHAETRAPGQDAAPAGAAAAPPGKTS